MYHKVKVRIDKYDLMESCPETQTAMYLVYYNAYETILQEQKQTYSFIFPFCTFTCCLNADFVI